MLFENLLSRYLAYIILLLGSIGLHAQDIDLIRIQSAYYPKQQIKESTVNGEVGVFEWGLQFAIPQTFGNNGKTILLHRIEYGNLTVNSEANLPLGLVESKNYYHTISYNLGLLQTLSLRWQMLINFEPTLASDFGEKLSTDDLLYQANVLAINTKNEKLKYGFGLAYTTRIGRQRVIPMGLFNYNTSKMNLKLVFPINMSIMFNTPNNYVSYGLKAGLNGGVFNNSTDVQTISNEIDKVGYSRLIVGPAVTFRIKDIINLNLQGGITGRRRLEFTDMNGEIIDRTPKATPFFGVGIAFAPKIKNAESSLNY